VNDQAVVQEEKLAATSFLGFPEPLVRYEFDPVIQPCIPPIHLKIKSLIPLAAPACRLAGWKGGGYAHTNNTKNRQ
jgi:hypothetical protein